MTQTLERPMAPSGGPASAPTRPRRQWPHRLVPVALLLLGAVVLLYPVGATFYNNYHQTEFANRYAAQVEDLGPTVAQKEIADAEKYNATLPSGLLKDPWNAQDPRQAAAYEHYLQQLAVVDAMATIRIPAIHVNLPVYHGTSDATLARGVGHLFGSTLPVGGSGTHAVLTGHSSLANATMFDHLTDLRVGDRFFIEVYGKTLAYEVDKIDVVLPDNLDGLVRFKGKDYVTLVTCTPYAVNSHRLLVRGHAVPYDAGSDPAATARMGFHWDIQSWMWTRIIGAGLALLLLLAMIAGWIRSDRRRRRIRLERAALAARS